MKTKFELNELGGLILWFLEKLLSEGCHEVLGKDRLTNLTETNLQGGVFNGNAF